MGLLQPRSLLTPRTLACLLGILAVILLATQVSAYQIYLNASGKVQVGTPIVVNGTTSLPTGVSIDLVFSKKGTQKGEEIARKVVTVQSTKNFTVTFPTDGLTKGTYWLEIPNPTGYRFGADSNTIFVIEMLDRSDEVEFRAPRTQEFDETLSVSGVFKGTMNAGIMISVTSVNTTIFGPGKFVKTDRYGVFSVDVPIEGPGTYTISFSDVDGYIGSVDVSVSEKAQPIEIISLPPTVISEPPTPTGPTDEAAAVASRDKPAFFKVTTKGGAVLLKTSSGVDWVIEYSDGKQGVQRMNDEGSKNPEVVTITTSEGTISVKVYPYLLSESGNVTLTGVNVESIEVLSGPESGGTTPSKTNVSSPMPAGVPLLASLVALLFISRRRRR